MRGRVIALADDRGRPLGPGGRSFTDEQAAAVERREGPLLLSANAGSGKTTVLAERFVRAVLQDGLRPAELLAITFTDKAAGELRARVRHRFAELGAREQARDAESAWISTIHGFCARVLRAHAVAAGLGPDFTVLDPAGARALRAAAFDRAFAALLDDKGDRPRLDALDLAATWTPDRLGVAIGAVHDELRSRGITRPVLPPAVPRLTVEDALAGVRAAHAGARTELEGARTLKSIDAARDALGACAELLGAAGAPTRAAVAGLTFNRGNAAELKSGACAAYLEAVAALDAAVLDAGAVGAHALLDELLRGFGAHYAAAKERDGALDYDDLELCVRDLFAAQPAIAAGYAERFARVMVDEFQDTNPLQLEVIDQLDRANVFAVGDALQSIYGFRHADVRGFRRRRAEQLAAGTAAELRTNWRTQPDLLDSLNAAFGPVHDGYVPLVAGLAAAEPGPAPSPSPRLELLLTDAAWDADDSPEHDAARAAAGAGLPAAKAARHAEARAVARRVRELVDAGECAAREVAVLLRAATDMGLYERALEAEGLATLASGGRGFWARQQVLDLTSYLAALANPYDEAALLGVLASPLAGLSSDALVLLSLGAREYALSLWEAVERAPEVIDRLPVADRAALTRFAARFAAERAGAPGRGLDVLLTRVVADTGYDLHVLRLPGGRRRLANVQKLVRLAAAYEERNGRDVRGFIDHATAELEADAREADAPIEMGDFEAVRLMTIHAAKGLEFGVVVVADLGRRGNASVGDLLVDGDRVGVRVVTMDEHESAGAFAHDELKAEAQAAELEEDRRVFHVAFTRAERRLVLSGAAALGKPWPKTGPAACPLAWIGPALGPGLTEQLTPAAPRVELDEARQGGRLRARVTLNAPAAPAFEMPRAGIAARPAAVVAPRGGVAAPPAAAAASAAASAPPSGAASPAGAPSPPPAANGQLVLDFERAEAPAPPGRAEAPAPFPVTALSYSALHDHAACGYRFYLERVLRLARDEDGFAARGTHGGLDPRVRGTLVHQLLEELDFAAPLPPPAARIAELAAGLGVELDAEEHTDVSTLVAAFAVHPLCGRLAAATDVHREHGFAFAAGPDAPLLNGFVDVRARERDLAVVVDYKTDRLAPGADLEELVARDYRAQRHIYALAELHAGAAAVEVHHVFLERPGEAAVASYEAADAGALVAALRAGIAAIAAREFAVAAVPHAGLCLGCPGRRALCSHPPELTGRVLGEDLALAQPGPAPPAAEI